MSFEWSDVGGWLQKNGKGLLGLAGAVATGNLPAGVAAVASMVAEATGETDPTAAMLKLQQDPATMVKFEEIAKRNEADIRAHHRQMLEMTLEDRQKGHEQTQLTIRAGDASGDKQIRWVRPTMAKQSWVATIGYCVGCFGVHAITGQDLFNVVIATILSSPAWAYLGLRTADRFSPQGATK